MDCKCKSYQKPLKNKEVILKFLVIGDNNVGKTAIVKRYIEGKFTSNYKTTIGVDFGTRTILNKPGTRITIQLWDTAGNERYKCLSRVYYKYAVGCVMVFDVTRPATLASAKKWLEELREKVYLEDGNNIPVVLLANKWDSDELSILTTDIYKFCIQNNILDWFPTSAKFNINIDEAILWLVKGVLERTEPIENPTPDLIKIDTVNKREKNHCC